MSITQCKLFSMAQWLRTAGGDLLRRAFELGDVEAGFRLDFASSFARALNHYDGAQPRPIVALLKPGDIVEDGVVARRADGPDCFALNYWPEGVALKRELRYTSLLFK